MSHNLSRTVDLWNRARQVMPGGVTASARMNKALQHPIIFDHGHGAYLTDIDGNRYIDYCVSHGASLLGHGHPAIIEAAQAALSRGLMMSCETDTAIDVAERLLALFPGMEMLRYCGTGTETTWHAIRVARAYTGRLHVIKFEGHYHGVNDTVGYSHWPDLALAGPAHSPRPVPDSAGIPPANDALITLLPFNDVAAFQRCLAEMGDKVAVVIMEPINYDSCGLVPTPEFLEVVRAETAQRGIILIFDEVLSGFRRQAGPVLGDDVAPDMTVLGKAVGGSMPISVFMGRKEIMETCTPVGPALHSGTYNAPLIHVAAIGAFLDVVTREGFYDHLDALGEKLYGGMREIMARHGVQAWVQGVGARFGLLFGLDKEPTNYRDVAKQDMEMMGRFHLGCLKRGVYFAHVSPHHGFSSAHSMADIERTLQVMDDAVGEM